MRWQRKFAGRTRWAWPLRIPLLDSSSMRPRPSLAELTTGRWFAIGKLFTMQALDERVVPWRAAGRKARLVPYPPGCEL